MFFGVAGAVALMNCVIFLFSCIADSLGCLFCLLFSHFDKSWPCGLEDSLLVCGIWFSGSCFIVSIENWQENVIFVFQQAIVLPVL